MLRSCFYLPALMPLLGASLAMGQSSDYQIQNVTPGQPGEVRMFAPQGQPVQEMMPPNGGDVRLWSKGPASALSLGVYVSPVTPVMASQLRLRRGAGLVVEGVVPGSPAEHAGIQRYDVIERINNRSVASNAQVEQMLRGNNPGGHVPLLIIREGNRQNIDVTVESAPQPKRMPDQPFGTSPKDYFPNRFQFSPDQTRELQQMSEQLKKEVEQQERQIERLKENLRREADQARRELEQLKDQIRSELEQQKRQMLDQLKTKPDSSSDKRDDQAQQDRN
ncbi:MAG TPA: PDZ domain-containing protein [Tepidisphaeraceae bacterium]|nr:PDZ domain-containing protein [Tepidisphaeraceae bacterium]